MKNLLQGTKTKNQNRENTHRRLHSEKVEEVISVKRKPQHRSSYHRIGNTQRVKKDKSRAWKQPWGLFKQTQGTKGSCRRPSPSHAGLRRRRDKIKLRWEEKKAVCSTHLRATRVPRWYRGTGYRSPQRCKRSGDYTSGKLWSHKGTTMADLMGRGIRSWIWKAPGQYQLQDCSLTQSCMHKNTHLQCKHCVQRVSGRLACRMASWRHTQGEERPEEILCSHIAGVWRNKQFLNGWGWETWVTESHNNKTTALVQIKTNFIKVNLCCQKDVLTLQKKQHSPLCVSVLEKIMTNEGVCCI